MHIYFAQFNPLKDKPDTYSVFFPDFPDECAHSHGLESALTAAQEFLELQISRAFRDCHILPRPSSLKDARKKAHSRNKRLDIEESPDAFFQAVGCDIVGDTTALFSTSLKRSLIAELKYYARQRHKTQAAFVAAAIEHYIRAIS